jgi:hypothetical protein
MAKNWSAYEAAKEIYGNNKENIAEIGSRFPLFARTVALADSDYLLDILKALPAKVTARVVETGLKDMETEEPELDVPQEEEAPKKGKAKKQDVEEQEDEWSDDEEEESTYESMTAKDLYALCCKRGISSMCKSRKKDELIKLLEKLDNGEIEPSKGKGKAKEEKKTTSKKVVKKEEPVEEEDDDWGEDEEETDPYVGKSAMELFKMCKERGLKVKPKQKPDVYADMLKADDAKGEEDTEEEDDDDWEI